MTSDSEVEDCVLIAVRALDNVIDLNFYPPSLTQSDQRTLPEHRPGVMGIIICWQSTRHQAGKRRAPCTADQVFERLIMRPSATDAVAGRKRAPMNISRAHNGRSGEYLKEGMKADDGMAAGIAQGCTMHG